MQEKKGISLIVLVITIIVMVILAAAVIITISNTSIIDRAEGAVETTNYQMLKEYAQTVWADAYASGKRTDAELSKAVTDALAASKLDLSNYLVEADKNGVRVTEFPRDLPKEWRTNVTQIVDGVPIPKGFVASPYDGENTKDGGLVIYELQGNETKIPDTETHQQSLTGRDQFVWVPVDDMSTFVRKDYTNPPTYAVPTDWWAPTPDTSLNMMYGYDETWQQEVIAMYSSIEEYGGFYIGRYEVGINSKRNDYNETPIASTEIYTRMGKIPYTQFTGRFGNSYMKYTTGTSNTTGVVSTQVYGVQWDRTLAWFLETEAKDINNNTINLTDSTSYANFLRTNIIASDLNDGAQIWDYTADSTSTGQYVSKDTSSLYPKVDSEGTAKAWLLTTGALKASKINNIYDMAGNVAEMTNERTMMAEYAVRGGCFNYLRDSMDVVSVASRLGSPVAFPGEFAFTRNTYITLHKTIV